MPSPANKDKQPKRGRPPDGQSHQMIQNTGLDQPPENDADAGSRTDTVVM